MRAYAQLGCCGGRHCIGLRDLLVFLCAGLSAAVEDARNAAEAFGAGADAAGTRAMIQVLGRLAS